MIYLSLFSAFFVANMIGYGGGPAIIPLIEAEVVGRFGWMTASEFAKTLAIGNALPSPIATKMAGQIGYDVAGFPGAAVALFATAAPSLLLMLAALGVILKFKDSPRVKRMSSWVRPVITVLMAILVLSFFKESMAAAGAYHTAILAVAAAIALVRFKIHPALVVSSSLFYGALFLG
ncbi:chromate transporter [Marinobacter sp. X15-166B]|uniref:chromate transporter n=1 Tax=Marinobacter sp. X15-166B TaxID=1897620 RepID=UPI00085BFCAE|nr:chromate transporter [Marinobacter sp. X15-166B]OEY66026.1 transporter [Marinobacter sp. X15-166B]